MRSGAVAAILLAIAAAAGASGCGERRFTAEEFVGAANDKDAGLALGAVVTTSDDGAEVYAIESAPAPGDEPNPQLEGSGGGRGTLVVAEDAGRAGEEYERCDGAADLTCFRAANVVLRFEAMDPADRARISGALSALASEG